MSWTGDTVTAGFTTGTPFRDLSGNVASNNVMDEEGVASSLLEHYRGLYQLRDSYPAIAAGATVVLSSAGEAILLFRRDSNSERILIAANVSGTMRSVSADVGWADTEFEAVYGGTGQVSTDAAGMLTINVAPRSTVVYYAAIP
jgi:alpha-amylase